MQLETELTAALARVKEVEQQNRTNATELNQIRPMRDENERLVESNTALLKIASKLAAALELHGYDHPALRSFDNFKKGLK